MRLANHDGRLVLVLADGIVDVAEASAGRFPPDPVTRQPRGGTTSASTVCS